MSIRIKLLIACLVLLGVFVGKGFYAQQTVNSSASWPSTCTTGRSCR
jgi:hypothetical protein